MKLIFFLILLCAGCASGPQEPKADPRMRTVQFDSDPKGARIFFGVGPNESMANSARSFIGTTPFEWSYRGKGDGTFEFEGIFLYSMAVRPAAVFAAEPPSSATNLFKKQQVFHGGAVFIPPDKIPTGVFFDLTKP